MATMQPGMMQGGQDPDAATEGQEQQGTGGFCIEIHVGADGKISVSAEPEAEETQEEGGEADDGDEGTPVPNIKAALTLALEIFKAGGEMPDDQGADDAFSAGLGSKGSY